MSFLMRIAKYFEDKTGSPTPQLLGAIVVFMAIYLCATWRFRIEQNNRIICNRLVIKR